MELPFSPHCGLNVRCAGEALRPRHFYCIFLTFIRFISLVQESKRAAEKLQASLRSTAAQKTEINADINVARTEAIIRLQPLYTAMQRAAQTNDFAAFQTAKDQYTQSFALEQAKHQATKVRAQNRINAIDSDVKNKISEAEIKAQVQPPATAVGNGLSTAVAGMEGQVTAVGNAVQDAGGHESIIGNGLQDEAQGQFAASTVAGNGGILNEEETGSAQGPGEGTGEAVHYFKDEQLKTEPNEAYFWSGSSNGIGGRDFAMNHAAKNEGTTLEGLMKRQGINMPTWDIGDPIAMKAWDDASAAYARQVSGEVRAIIGSSLRPKNVWQTIELPRLKDNPYVTKIITIDPETLSEKVILWR